MEKMTINIRTETEANWLCTPAVIVCPTNRDRKKRLIKVVVKQMECSPQELKSEYDLAKTG